MTPRARCRGDRASAAVERRAFVAAAGARSARARRGARRGAAARGAERRALLRVVAAPGRTFVYTPGRTHRARPAATTPWRGRLFVRTAARRVPRGPARGRAPSRTRCTCSPRWWNSASRENARRAAAEDSRGRETVSQRVSQRVSRCRGRAFEPPLMVTGRTCPSRIRLELRSRRTARSPSLKDGRRRRCSSPPRWDRATRASRRRRPRAARLAGAAFSFLRMRTLMRCYRFRCRFRVRARDARVSVAGGGARGGRRRGGGRRARAPRAAAAARAPRDAADDDDADAEGGPRRADRDGARREARGA